MAISQKGGKKISNVSVGNIDRVEPAREFHHSTGGKWVSILKAFNPFGAIAEAYAQTLAYRIETKRLEVELARIEKQADIAHDVIDKSFKLKMEELIHRRIALVGFYETVNAELQRLHIERVKVLEMAQEATMRSQKKNERRVNVGRKRERMSNELSGNTKETLRPILLRHNIAIIFTF